MKKAVLAAGAVVGSAIALAVGAQIVSNCSAEKEVDRVIANVSDVVDVEYKDVESTFFSQGTKVQELTLSAVGSEETVSIDEVTVYEYETTEEDIPEALDVAIEGIALRLSDIGEQGEALRDIGYGEELLVNVAAKYEYEAEENAVHIEKMTVGADDVGDFDMNLKLANVSLDTDAIAGFPFSFFGVAFEAAEITYRDDSFMDKMFEAMAESEGISVQELKAELIEGLDSGLDESADELDKELVSNLKDFIQNPDSFSVSFSPNEPINFLTFMGISGDPEALVDTLNIRFES